VGPVAAVGRQISSETSGAPSGPGTDRSSTVKAPPRRRSSSLGRGVSGLCRSTGISSAVSGAENASANCSSATAHSGSNGGGGPISAAGRADGDVSVTGPPGSADGGPIVLGDPAAGQPLIFGCLGTRHALCRLRRPCSRDQGLWR
jgi:hypothetical protein